MAIELSSRKVLLVDDDESLRALFAEVLAVAGYQVRTAGNGAEALNSLKNGYDLVVTDINMPGLDGLELYTRALDQFPYLERRFVFMTGSDDGEACSAIRRLNGICLIKPFKISDFINAVDTIASCVSLDPCTRENRGKRSEQRFSLAVDCEVDGGSGIETKTAPATIENVSRNGLEIRYAGEPLKHGRGLSISFSVGRMNTVRDGEVVWSKSAGGKECLAGVRLTEPIPVYWILSAAPRIDNAHNF